MSDESTNVLLRPLWWMCIRVTDLTLLNKRQNQTRTCVVFLFTIYLKFEMRSFKINWFIRLWKQKKKNCLHLTSGIFFCSNSEMTFCLFRHTKQQLYFYNRLFKNLSVFRILFWIVEGHYEMSALIREHFDIFRE